MRKGNGDGREVIGSDEFDFVADRLGLLLWLDENMRAHWTPF